MKVLFSNTDHHVHLVVTNTVLHRFPNSDSCTEYLCRHVSHSTPQSRTGVCNISCPSYVMQWSVTTNVIRYPILGGSKPVRPCNAHSNASIDKDIDISPHNIMATTPSTILSNLDEETTRKRKGTIIDWNYSYTANGSPSSRSFKTGTLPYMAVDILASADLPEQHESKSLRRTLQHDLESFFMVVLVMASRCRNPKWKKTVLAKDLTYGAGFLHRTKQIFRIISDFNARYLDGLSPEIRNDEKFIILLHGIRSILYPLKSIDKDPDETGPSVPPKSEEDGEEEQVFMDTMGIIEHYIGDQSGQVNLRTINERKAQSDLKSRHTPSR